MVMMMMIQGVQSVSRGGVEMVSGGLGACRRG